MSYFSWIAWIKPESALLAAVSGTNTGLGLNPLPTFDWKYVFLPWVATPLIVDIVVEASIQPLISPFFAMANNFVGMLCTFPIVLSIWLTNTCTTRYTGHLCRSVQSTSTDYDHFGKQYKVTKVVNEFGFYDQAAYEAYSPLYLSAGQAFLYGSFFAAPEWWYTCLLLVSIALGSKSLISTTKRNLTTAAQVIAILAYPTHTSVRALFMGLALTLVFIVPIGVIYTVTNTEVTLNVLAEFIGGVLFPGNALAMNMYARYLLIFLQVGIADGGVGSSCMDM
ncbi:hypothetical protein FRC10_004862 [Ceratobasidium sp. 414]|nr:hypothetical protein FRC10_004862 [Ceratobasidium sp. 414]